jgi:hypothetical protein
MGRHTDPPAMGSRRATVVTLTASALLVAGGFAILHQSGGPRPEHPSTPSTPSAPLVTPSRPPGDVPPSQP